MVKYLETTTYAEEIIMKQQPKKLYLSNKNRKIAGFCGGLAEYLDVDPTLVRLGYILLTLITMGAGIVFYIIAWFIVPRNQKQ